MFLVENNTIDTGEVDVGRRALQDVPPGQWHTQVPPDQMFIKCSVQIKNGIRSFSCCWLDVLYPKVCFGGLSCILTNHSSWNSTSPSRKTPLLGCMDAKVYHPRIHRWVSQAHVTLELVWWKPRQRANFRLLRRSLEEHWLCTRTCTS